MCLTGALSSRGEAQLGSVLGRAGSGWALQACCVMTAGTLSGLQGPGGQDRAPGGAAAACLQQPDGSFLSAQVDVSFSLSLELLSYQKLPADQMLPGVDIQQSASGEKEMVFTQNLLLEYTNQTTQVSPRPAPRAEEGGTGLDCFGGVRGGQTPTEPSEIRGAQSALEEALPMERWGSFILTCLWCSGPDEVLQ